MTKIYVGPPSFSGSMSSLGVTGHTIAAGRKEKTPAVQGPLYEWKPIIGKVVPVIDDIIVNAIHINGVRSIPSEHRFSLTIYGTADMVSEGKKIPGELQTLSSNWVANAIRVHKHFNGWSLILSEPSVFEGVGRSLLERFILARLKAIATAGTPIFLRSAGVIGHKAASSHEGISGHFRDQFFIYGGPCICSLIAGSTPTNPFDWNRYTASGRYPSRCFQCSCKAYWWLAYPQADAFQWVRVKDYTLWCELLQSQGADHRNAAMLHDGTFWSNTTLRAQRLVAGTDFVFYEENASVPILKRMLDDEPDSE
jgi:hypothetical protein